VKNFDRDLTDIFAVQDEIALAVTEALKLKLLGESRENVLKRHTNNTEAHEAYLKGRFFWSKFTLSGFQKSLDFFRQPADTIPGGRVSSRRVSTADHNTARRNRASSANTVPGEVGRSRASTWIPAWRSAGSRPALDKLMREAMEHLVEHPSG
jgi:hypothetical protein